MDRPRASFAVIALFVTTGAAAQNAGPGLQWPPETGGAVPQPAELAPETVPTATPVGPREDKRGRFALGVRGAWIVPAGYAEEHFSDGAQLTLEVGWRFPSAVTSALFAQVGKVSPRGSFCSIKGGGGDGSSCSGGDTYKLGAQILYDFRRDHELAAFSPFVGVGFGFESFGYDWKPPASPNYESNSEPARVRLEGPFAEVQLGVQWQFAPGAFIGPFASASLGRYSDVERAHHWIQLGIRFHSEGREGAR